MRQLPSSWAYIPLGDVGTWRGGGTPSKEVGAFWTAGKVPWVSPKDMKTARIRDSEDHITEQAIEQSAVKRIGQGSVLVVVRSGILAHTFPVAVTDVEVTVNQDLKALTPAEGIDPEYMAWALRAFGKDILRECKKDGTTVASIEFKAMLRFEVPLAPLEEQRRVVDVIDSMTTRFDAAVAALARVHAKLRAYRAAVLKSALEGRLVPTDASLACQEKRGYEPAKVLLDSILSERRRRWEEAATTRSKARGRRSLLSSSLTLFDEPPALDTKTLPVLPEGWCWTTLGVLSTIIRGVTYQQRDARSEPGPGLLPLLRATNVGDGLTFSDLVYVPEKVVSAQQRLRVGDIVVASSSGSLSVVGKAATLHSAWIGTFGAFCMVVRPATPAIASYLSMFLMTPWYRERASKLAAGVNINNLKRSQLEAMPIPLPPPAEMGRIIEQVQQQLSVAGDLITVTGRHIEKQCARLHQAILNSAFEGRLVDQDSSDEPADKLVVRIRASGDVLSSSKKTHGRRVREAV